jgi:hypothetical protein
MHEHLNSKKKNKRKENELGVSANFCFNQNLLTQIPKDETWQDSQVWGNKGTELFLII